MIRARPGDGRTRPALGAERTPLSRGSDWTLTRVLRIDVRNSSGVLQNDGVSVCGICSHSPSLAVKHLCVILILLEYINIRA